MSSLPGELSITYATFLQLLPSLVRILEPAPGRFIVLRKDGIWRAYSISDLATVLSQQVTETNSAAILSALGLVAVTPGLTFPVDISATAPAYSQGVTVNNIPTVTSNPISRITASTKVSCATTGTPILTGSNQNGIAFTNEDAVNSVRLNDGTVGILIRAGGAPYVPPQPIKGPINGYGQGAAVVVSAQFY